MGAGGKRRAQRATRLGRRRAASRHVANQFQIIRGSRAPYLVWGRGGRFRGGSEAGREAVSGGASWGVPRGVDVLGGGEAVQLPPHQPLVNAGAGHELLVLALLRHGALVHHGNAVRIPHGAQPVGHHDDGPAPGQHERIQRLLDGGLALRVQGAGGLVQQHHLGLADEHPGEGEPLALAAAQLHAALAHHGAVALGEGGDELVRVRLLGGPLQVRAAVPLHPVRDVLLDAAGEDLGLLRHDAHEAVDGAAVKVADVPAVQQDPPGGGRVELHQQT
mmetsp:Transcript_15524/g.39457  ORF Transcript_15524/g.39457 Transcript_15524/m.39457 type:complete len:276 (+) Transcript_15524:40-867(+)